MSRLAAQVLVLVGLAGLAGIAHAEPPGAADVARARAEFEQGQTAYRKGQLPEALAHLRRAYETLPSPELEWNLARVYERMGEAQAAIAHYERYLASGAPAAAERRDIDARLRALRALIERQQAQIKAPPPSASALTAEARAFFERGVKLFAKKQYAAAQVAFATARRYAALPELTYNLALASERMGKRDEAVDYYRAYLREAQSAPDRERVEARVQALLAELDAAPAR